jgi:hypothetical protein
VTKRNRLHWHCVKRDCGWSAVPVELPNSETAKPRCVCGSPKETSEVSPVFSYLDFLWGEEPLAHANQRDEE